jgi:alkylation response protein AidB-like acyl-CoA dehydrogenase
VDVLSTAERLADEVLFPAALATDTAEAVPVDLLDILAEAGLYGLSGPVSAGGLDADFPTVCSVVEKLASGCLTTTFVWVQHLGAVIAAAGSDNAAIRDWVAPLCKGRRRAGLALGGAIPGRPLLRARETENGWTFTGTSPYVSGWDRVDVLHTAARTDDGRLVWALIDARESATLMVERLTLVALNATATVQADFLEHEVAAQRVTSVGSYHTGPVPPEPLRIHAALALGVARRCCRLLGPTPLDEELARVRAELDRLDPATIEAARGSAGEVALRAAAALAVATGSRSLLVADHAQRLIREALFGLVYALRPGSRDAVLVQLRATAS